MYPKLKKDIGTDHQAAWDFLNQLAREAEFYSEPRNPTDDFWSSKSTARMLREKRTLNIRVTFGLLLALWCKLRNTPQQFEDWVRKVLSLMIQYSKVAEYPTNLIAGDLSKWSVDFRSGAMTLDELGRALKAKSPNQGIFVESFKSLKIKSGPTARLLLMKISNALNEGGEPEALVADSEKAALEHVIPQNPDEDWREFLDKKGILLADVRDRVGNLTPLTGRKNSASSNKSFAHKLDTVYRHSSLPITQHSIRVQSPENAEGMDSNNEPSLLEEFGLREINQRQEQLAIIAERLFRVEQAG